MESGAIKASDCVDALALRTRLGRACSSCSGTTYLLPDQNDSEEKCEFCNSGLVPKKARRSESKPKSDANARPSSGSGETRPPRPRRSTASRRVERARAARSSEGPSKMLAALEARINALEGAADVAALVTEAVESSLAALDLDGLIERASKEAAAGHGGGGGGGGGLGGNSGDILDPEQIAEDVAGKALALVQARVDTADLSGLYDKVTEIATERTLETVEASAQAAVEAAAQGVGGGGGGGAAGPDLNELAAEVSESAVQQALAAVKEELDSRPPAPSGGGAADEELRNALQALEEYVQQYDLAGLSERLTTVEGAGSAAASGDTSALAESIEALQLSLDEVQSKLSPLLGLDLKLETLEGEVRAAASSDSEGGAAPDAAELESRIIESVSKEVNARLERDLDGLPDRIGQEASAPVLAAIEARINKLDLKNLPTRVAEDATAEVMILVREQAASEAQRAVAEAAAGANGGGADQGKILEAVELRLAQNPPPEEIVQMASAQAIAAFEERLAEVSAGSSSGGPSPDEIVQMASAQAIAAFEERLAEVSTGSSSGGPSPDEIVQMATGQAIAAFEERLAEVSAGSSSGGPSPDEIVQMAAGQAIAAVDERLAAIGSGGSSGGVDEAKVDEIARKIALDVVASHAKLAGMGVGEGDPTATQILKRAQGSAIYDHKKFISLAREVKNVKDALKKGAGGGGGGGGDSKALNDKADKADLRTLAVQVTKCEDWIERLRGSGPTAKPGAAPAEGGGASLSEILSSTEFKQVFDTKINQVLGYIKSDVVPKAVKKALESS